ncbi:hypothetical protein TNCV_637701 [Trichonephila clavipes]|nr:hypothetical protein TNCV_637701 [Trichonephila clavipes]
MGLVVRKHRMNPFRFRFCSCKCGGASSGKETKLTPPAGYKCVVNGHVHPSDIQSTSVTVRVYYGQPVLSAKITGDPKIQSQVLVLRTEIHMLLYFGENTRESFFFRGNENLDLGLEFEAIRSNFGNNRKVTRIAEILR